MANIDPAENKGIKHGSSNVSISTNTLASYDPPSPFHTGIKSVWVHRWLPVHFQMLKLFHLFSNCPHCPAPQYRSDLLQASSPFHSLRSADQTLLIVPKTKRKLRGSHLLIWQTFSHPIWSTGPWPAWPTLLCLWLAKPTAPALILP